MKLIHRVQDVCPFIEMKDPDNQDNTILKARSSMFRFIDEWQEARAHTQLDEITPDTRIDGASIADLGGEVVYVEVTQ